MTTRRRGPLERRGAAAVLFGLFVAGGLIFVFAGTLARSTALEAEAEAARAEVAALEGRVAVGLEEIEFIESDRFIEQMARSIGFGESGEIAFRLPEDAPPPQAIAPLGIGAGDRGTHTPLEDWLELLFGA